ncbi:SGNH/GDSL hydrolase family protein [Roseovarius aestuariivivens]|uniref:SGNH/GDSL hydrolase family protein n=1 Tax=Roseovarius aestuariivivens TaxID=1888910 RepID=UPI001080758B|nr:SGNH/GDSL hydrolase family protein [Roseovarius aestuariivivens]
MKKILWCGGSHLANARPLIEEAHDTGALGAFDAEFYVTGGPRNRDWSGAGGRYTVEGSVVSGNAHEPERRIDLAAFDAAVFIGQYIQPFKAFIGDVPHSSSVVERTLRELPIEGRFHDPERGIRHRWYNEPLVLFPPLVSGPTFLLPDPAPVGKRYGDVPQPLKQAYHNRMTDFCAEAGITYVDMPPELFTEDGRTRRRYALPGDALHMNAEYWHVVFDKALLPAMTQIL